ncbi:putative metal-binding motif-containing protein [Nannocystis punicea]|uniref:Metal-binding motif-containing protein n=1 Tax=Nannocystis punicea TaxID=2995304 RepID=A0ABY7HCK6_9BACT|nr:putative metal-binding motif-containing protein [Nannocystis poenicansa]WAS96729.1 putative metal-binding motif-containing protein [Nannocystis poenicansa]
MRIFASRVLGWSVFVILAGCGDDLTATTASESDASSTATGSDTSSSTSSTSSDPTTTTDTGGTDSMTGTTSTTGSVDPTSSSTTGDGSTSTSTSTSTTGETTSSTTGEDTTTGELCVDGVVCEGNIAVICEGEVPSMEECEHLCVDGVGCLDCVSPGPEICDGLDNDCDGVADGPGVCPAGSCSGGGGACVELTIPDEHPLVSGCRQQFPPPQSLQCPIAEPGPVFHLSAATGDDANDGTTPETAWQTLCHAVDAAPAGSTLRVAEGKYASAEVYVGKELTIKGGFDGTFTTWDPDAHPSTFYGRLNLDHNGAVFGGFRMIANPLHADAWSYPHHFVGAGTLVRNYVEIVATSGGDPNTLNLYGIVASACPGGVSVLRCNDIYVRSDAPQTFVVSAVEYGNHALHAGQGVLDANRICQDGGGFATDAVGGYGSCFPNPVSLLLRNNVIEKAGAGGHTIDFYSCGNDDMSLTLTNNTVIGVSEAIHGSGDPAVMMRWKLTNNIFFSAGGGQTAVDAGDVGVEITSSEGNLSFGFADNAILPAPLMSAGDDLSGAATQASVFVDAMNGDLHLKEGGQGVDTGLNVFGLPAHGVVTTDIAQQLRPPQGPWDRGAFAF